MKSKYERTPIYLGTIALGVCILLFVLTLIAGCAHSPRFLIAEGGKQAHQCLLPVMVGIHHGANVEQTAAIKRSLRYWNGVTDKKFFLSLGTIAWSADNPLTHGFLPVEVVDDKVIHEKRPSACGHTHMYVMHNSGCIRIPKIRIAKSCAVDIGSFETIVRHELGHVLGFDDRRLVWTDLMYPGLEPTMQHPVDLSGAEVEALQGVYP